MNKEECLSRAHRSLQGLSVGDAFGERFFFHPAMARQLVEERAFPRPPWRYTDDTQMALSVVEVLSRCGEIEQDELAHSFAENYDETRGYGPAMHGLLGNLQLGVPWQRASRWLFHGQGSFGNGAAMRVAPVGAYFADDLTTVVENARRSAEVTHAHPEAAAGAIAVAIAAAWAWRQCDSAMERVEFLDLILPHVPDSHVKRGIARARDLPAETEVEEAARELGNGDFVSAQDTVPFTLWCAGGYLDNFEEALWRTVSGLGDRDTTCAIVGGIVALSTQTEIPAVWLSAREPLPNWSVT
jgi:ADP-ribosylglycohydrolase